MDGGSANIESQWLTADTPQESPIRSDSLSVHHNETDLNTILKQQEEERAVLASCDEHEFEESERKGLKEAKTVDHVEGHAVAACEIDDGLNSTRNGSRVENLHHSGTEKEQTNSRLRVHSKPTQHHTDARTLGQSPSLRDAYYALVQQQPRIKHQTAAVSSTTGYASSLNSARSHDNTPSYASSRYSTNNLSTASSSYVALGETGRARPIESRDALVIRNSGIRGQVRHVSPAASMRVSSTNRGSGYASVARGKSPAAAHQTSRHPSSGARILRQTVGDIPLRQTQDTSLRYPTRGTKARGQVMQPQMNRTSKLDSHSFSNRLQALMIVRDRMEHLAATHRQEEAALREMLQQLIHKEDPGKIIEIEARQSSVIPPHPEPPRELMEANSDLRRQIDEYSRKCEEIDLKLRDALSERDKAINLLEKFQEEGSKVIESLHASVKKANQENVKMLQQNESLMQENLRLKDMIKRITTLGHQKARKEDVDDPQKGSSDGGDELEASIPQNTDETSSSQQDYQISVKFHEEIVCDYQVLLGEADDVITSLRSANEELKRSVHSLEARLESYVGFESGESAGEGNDHEVGNTKRPQSNLEKNLLKELRAERQQRLEAEEHAHELSAQHQKHTSLLEQRIAHLTKLLYGSRGDRGGASSSASSVASLAHRGLLSSPPIPLQSESGRFGASSSATTAGLRDLRHPLVSGLSLSGVHVAPSTCGTGSTLQTSRTEHGDVFSPSPGRTPRQEVNWSFVYEKQKNEPSAEGKYGMVSSPVRLDAHTPLTVGEVSTVTSTQFSVVQCETEKIFSESNALSPRESGGPDSHSGCTSPSSTLGIGDEYHHHALSPFQIRRLHRDQALSRKSYLAPDASPVTPTVPRLSIANPTVVQNAIDPEDGQSELVRLADEADLSEKPADSPTHDPSPCDSLDLVSQAFSANDVAVTECDSHGEHLVPRSARVTDDSKTSEKDSEEALFDEADEIAADLF